MTILTDAPVSPRKGVQDSLGILILRRGLQALDFSLRSGTWILDSNRLWDSGFLELYSRFQSPGL